MGPVSSGFTEVRSLFDKEVNEIIQDFQKTNDTTKLKEVRQKYIWSLLHQHKDKQYLLSQVVVCQRLVLPFRKPCGMCATRVQIPEFVLGPLLHSLLKICLWLLSLKTCSSSTGMQNVDQLMNLPFNSVKMEPCYLKVNLLQELLQDLKNRFKVYHIDFVIQRTQNLMQEVL